MTVTEVIINCLTCHPLISAKFSWCTQRPFTNLNEKECIILVPFKYFSWIKNWFHIPRLTKSNFESNWYLYLGFWKRLDSSGHHFVVSNLSNCCLNFQVRWAMNKEIPPRIFRCRQKRICLLHFPNHTWIPLPIWSGQTGDVADLKTVSRRLKF